MRRLPTVGVLASLVVVLTGVVLLVLAMRPADRAPEPPRAAASDAAIERPPAPTDPESDGAGGPAAATPSKLGRSVPTTVAIPKIGVTSRLIRLGVDGRGRMQVPQGKTYDRAGWFTGSPTPGQVGPSVIAGHVDSKRGPSVFYRLGALTRNDRVDVTRTDGTRVTYRVYRAERYAKSEFPTATVYGNTAGPELRLITCSGDIGPDGHYRDNTVVYARIAPQGSR